MCVPSVLGVFVEQRAVEDVGGLTEERTALVGMLCVYCSVGSCKLTQLGGGYFRVGVGIVGFYTETVEVFHHVNLQSPV